jgi:hypothetical protein
MQNLQPEGLWIGVGVRDREEGEAVLKRIAAWR